MIKQFILIVLFFSGLSFSSAIISEVLANPNFLEDSEAEFIELINLSSNPIDINIIYKENFLSLSNLQPGIPVLICRDSVTLSSIGISCFSNWTALSLTNSTSLHFTIQNPLDTLHFVVPVAKPGKSWENRYNTKTKQSQWEIATTSSNLLQNDFGTPFELPFDELFVFNHNLKLDSIYLQETASTIQFNLVIENIGKQTSPTFSIKTTLYQNGLLENGFELQIHTNNDPILPNKEMTVFLKFEKFQQGIFHFEISEDDFNSNNSRVFFYHHPSNIIISEVCPSPLEGQPEWFELTNVSDQKFSLQFITYNYNFLSSSVQIKPQESIIITNNQTQFEILYNDLNLTVIQPFSWDILSNSGDSIFINFKHPLSNFVFLDSMHYPSITTSQKNNCWIRDANKKWASVSNQNLLNASPGYIASVSSQLTWELNSKIIRKDKNEILNLKIQTPVGQTVDVKIFDLKGREIQTLCTLCSGFLQLKWDGTKYSSSIPAGPYILWIHEQQQKPVKIIIILAQEF